MREPPVLKSGRDLLADSRYNKGTAFTFEERSRFRLHGLLPVAVSSISQQLRRVHQNFSMKRTSLGKYAFLMQLLNRNEHLFYQYALAHAEEVLPYIYTPTVGEASIQYSQMYTENRGLYLSFPLADRIEEMIDNLGENEIDVIVVTDGERILGLGDQGIGGMTIPVGKLSLYTVFGGIHPMRTLPVLLDVGTNNPDHLGNDLYLGWRHARVQGAEYDQFIARFVSAVRKKYPNALLQWEDFGKQNARRLLQRYRSEILSFNDDIQGTAAVVLAALLAASHRTREPLREMKVVIFGAGSAGIGIAEMIVLAMIDQGLTREEAQERIYLVDVHGLIHVDTPALEEEHKPFAHTHAHLRGWTVHNSMNISLQEVVANVRPSALIGVAAQPGAFTKEIVQSMATHCQRPIILPLSNPTSKSEATPQELWDWTDGQALLATGSPFGPTEWQGKKIAHSQCNNVYIFPGLGLGALAAGATQVTDGMILAAANALAEQSPNRRDPFGPLFPPIADVRATSRLIALTVARRAVRDGVARVAEGDLTANIEDRVWEPGYTEAT
jgi:malate dehydrogenase (oxaloacetate-decarboxylating)